MEKVYIVEHVHKYNDESEDIKFIGAYSTRENAVNAVDRLGHKPGFAQTREGFHINEIIVDRDQWTEGFISWKSAMK